jgi:hypothetical protein
MYDPEHQLPLTIACNVYYDGTVRRACQWAITKLQHVTSAATWAHCESKLTACRRPAENSVLTCAATNVGNEPFVLSSPLLSIQPWREPLPRVKLTSPQAADFLARASRSIALAAADRRAFDLSRSPSKSRGVSPLAAAKPTRLSQARIWSIFFAVDLSFDVAERVRHIDHREFCPEHRLRVPTSGLPRRRPAPPRSRVGGVDGTRCKGRQLWREQLGATGV